MVRKLLFSFGGLSLLGLMFVGRDAGSYVTTSAGWVTDSVKNSVPIEFEIERARKMVKELVPDIRRNMHVIAQEEVEIERLQKQIKQNDLNLDKDRGELLKLKNDLSSGNVSFQYAGRSYSCDQVKKDMTVRFERYKTHEATLNSLRDIESARRRSLEAARQKLEGMLTAKRQLEVDVENLEARLKMVEVAQTTSEYNIDDSQLGRVKELIGDLRTRLNVAERLVNSEMEFHSEIPVSEPVSANIADQISEYFAQPDAGKVADSK